MSNPISYNAFLGWVDATDPDNLPPEVRIIGASDLMRYENFGVAATTKINAESVRLDNEIVRLDAAEDAIVQLGNEIGVVDTSVGALDSRVAVLEAAPKAFVHKTVDTSRSATTLLAEDPHLKRELGPNELIEVTAVLFVTSVAAADIKVGFAGTGVTVGRWGSTTLGAMNTTLPNNYAIAYNTTGLTQTFILQGLIGAGPSGGHLGLVWAQYVSDPGATTVHSYSYLKTTTLSGG